MPKTLDARRAWLNQFIDALQAPANGLAAKYHAPAATLTALDNGRKWFNWALDNLGGTRATATSLTAFKDALITGAGPLVPPAAPAYTPVPASGGAPIPPLGGVFALASSLGTQIKAATDYTEADGRLLGLEGAEAGLPDPAASAPDLSGTHVTSGGLIQVAWNKGPFDGVRIEVDRNDGKGWQFLAVDTAPDYIDTVRPASGAAALYRYRAIHLLGDADYGQWSPPVEITARG